MAATWFPHHRSFYLGLVVVLGLGAMALVSNLLIGGQRSGIEFSPATFARREFQYREIPWLQIQLAPVRRRPLRDDLSKHLLQSNLLPSPSKNQTPRWDLIEGRGQNAEQGDFDSAILCHYLDARNANEELIWLKWTKQHPACAAELWPRIQTLAEDQLYIYLPHLFDRAGCTNAAELATLLDSQMAQIYLSLGQTEQSKSNHELAVRFFSRAIACQTENDAAYAARAEAYASQGAHEQSQADREKARQLRNNKS